MESLESFSCVNDATSVLSEELLPSLFLPWLGPRKGLPSLDFLAGGAQFFPLKQLAMENVISDITVKIFFWQARIFFSPFLYGELGLVWDEINDQT